MAEGSSLGWSTQIWNFGKNTAKAIDRSDALAFASVAVATEVVAVTGGEVIGGAEPEPRGSVHDTEGGGVPEIGFSVTEVPVGGFTTEPLIQEPSLVTGAGGVDTVEETSPLEVPA